MRSHAKHFLTGLGAATALAITPFLLQEAVFHARVSADIGPFRKSVNEHWEEFVEDQGELSGETFFNVKNKGRNAAEFLNPRLDWVGQRNVSTASAIQITQEHRDKLREWGRHFPRFHATMKFDPIDLSWMSQLSKYDYWDLLEGSSLENEATRSLLVNLFLNQTLVRGFEDLTYLAKLRLMKGLEDGHVEQAVRETRQLALLLYSTETLMGAMAMVAILRAQLHLEDYLTSSIQARIEDWAPLERDDVNRTRRAILGFNAIFSLFTPPEKLVTAFRDYHVGVCSALAKGILRTLLFRSLVEPKVAWERDFTPNLFALDKAYDDSHQRCRLTHLRPLWEKKDSRAVWLATYSDVSWDWFNLRWLQHVPYLRRAWGIDLATLHLSDGLNSYSRRFSD